MCTRQELAEFWSLVAENRHARALGITCPSLGRAKFLASSGFTHAQDKAPQNKTEPNDAS
jgi:hypothetical protein